MTTTRLPTMDNPETSIQTLAVHFGEETDSDNPISGTGRCRACSCTGYKKKPDTNYCDTCGHHWDQHR